MKKISRPIVFFGTENLSEIPLETLIEDGFDVVAVITKPDAPKGRRREMSYPEVKKIAIRHGIRVLQPERLKDIYDFIGSLDRPTGVLASYGKIIPQSIIDLFDPGILNIHPSLLPKYRGPTPIEAAMLNGDRETGVSLMKLVKEMDAGPVYAKKTLSLRGNETKNELYAALATEGIKLLVDMLPGILDGSVKPIEQNESEATYCEKFDKTRSLLNTKKKTALECYNQVRAFAGFPKTRLIIGDVDCIIVETSVAAQAETEIDVKCRDDKYLIVKKLAPAGRREMSANEFINGYISRRIKHKKPDSSPAN